MKHSSATSVVSSCGRTLTTVHFISQRPHVARPEVKTPSPQTIHFICKHSERDAFGRSEKKSSRGETIRKMKRKEWEVIGSREGWFARGLVRVHGCGTLIELSIIHSCSKTATQLNSPPTERSMIAANGSSLFLALCCHIVCSLTASLYCLRCTAINKRYVTTMF